MSGQAVRRVNVVPMPKSEIKKEVVSDEEEATLRCKICCKVFVSPIALRNHAMMEHFEAFATGDPSNWTDPETVNKSKPEKKTRLVKVNESLQPEQILSAMTHGSVTSLASEGVSYIIIKSEDDISDVKKRKVERPIREVPAKKPKETQAITGPFECLQDGDCHRIFFSCCEYSTHYRDEHTRRRKGLRCQVCEKPLSSEGVTEFLYTCDVCGAGFNSSKELSEHTSIAHVKLKPFKCDICNKRFTQQGGVQQHMRMHTGDRPFSCTFCPKAFTQKSGLDQHLRIHTKVKPYRCVICTKSFCQSIHLKQHMRTHTNVSPFQCGVCNKRFKQSSHLNYHLRNHNPANLTEEQKKRYTELIGMIVQNSGSVEVEVDTAEVPDAEQMEQIETEVADGTEVEVEIKEIDDGTEMLDISQEEQQAAEQSIEVWETDPTYVLSEETGEKWTIKLVD